MQWFRLYDDIINDPKILRLDETLRWRYISLLCIVSKNSERGYIPDDEDVCLMMRIDANEWADTKLKLIDRGLINRNEGKLLINGWFKRQYSSDDAAERVRKHREMKRYGNVTVTPPDTETDQIRTDAEEEAPPSRRGALDPTADTFQRALSLTNEKLSLTTERRRVLVDVLNNKDIGIPNFMLAVKNLVGSSWPTKSLTYFLDNKFEAVNRVDRFANAPPVDGGNSPPKKTVMEAPPELRAIFNRTKSANTTT